MRAARALLLLIATTLAAWSPASANDGFSIVIPGRAGVPIIIDGVESLKGVEHRIIPDRIETGTFMMAAAITNGELELKNCNLDHLIAVDDRLSEVGVKLERNNGTIFVSSTRRINTVEMTTQPYPGFPTDMQAQFMALMSVAGPQNLKSGNCPSSDCSASRRVPGCVHASGNLRPSAGYIGLGVTAQSTDEYMLNHQHTFEHVKLEVC